MLSKRKEKRRMINCVFDNVWLKVYGLSFFFYHGNGGQNLCCFNNTIFFSFSIVLYLCDYSVLYLYIYYCNKSIKIPKHSRILISLFHCLMKRKKRKTGLHRYSTSAYRFSLITILLLENLLVNCWFRDFCEQCIITLIQH